MTRKWPPELKQALLDLHLGDTLTLDFLDATFRLQLIGYEDKQNANDNPPDLGISVGEEVQSGETLGG